ALLRTPERAHERVVLEERPRADRAGHAHQILVQDTPRTHRQMSDLRVAHLPRRQPDRLPGCLERGMRVLGPQPVEDRRVGQLDRVSGPRRRAPPPVQDDECYELMRAAVSQIATKESGSSEAPPTSAPSTSAWRSSSSAFSGFTEAPSNTGTS